VGGLRAGETISVNLNGSVDSTMSGSITIVTSASSGEADRDSDDNTSTDVFTVDRMADLSLEMSSHGSVGTGVSGEAGATGGSGTGDSDGSYVITVGNIGPSGATGVIITDNLPSGVSLVSSTGDGLECLVSQQTVVCHAGDLGVHEQVTVTLNVSGNPGNNEVNQVNVRANEVDPSGENNVVTAAPRLAVEPTPSPVVLPANAIPAAAPTEPPPTAVPAPVTVPSEAPVDKGGWSILEIVVASGGGALGLGSLFMAVAKRKRLILLLGQLRRVLARS
jgi:uncharacterized repeat protein (TIGR01451 family)